MILDRNEAMAIDGAFPTVPRPDSAVVKRFMAGDIEIRYHKGAELMGEDVMIASPYSVTAHVGGRYVFAASIERDDLRALSPMIGVPLRALQSEYGVRGFYGEPRVTLYGGGEKESLGSYQGLEREDEIIPFLLSLVLDSLDEIAEPVEIQNAR